MIGRVMLMGLACMVLTSMAAAPISAQGNAPPKTFPQGMSAPTAPPSPAESAPTAAAPPESQGTSRAALSIVVQSLILGFGGFAMVIQYLYLRHSKRNSDNALQFFGLTLIIISTMYLFTVIQESSSFTSATFGLFGTIAGYLLGKTSGAREQPHEGEPGPPDAPAAAVPAKPMGQKP